MTRQKKYLFINILILIMEIIGTTYCFIDGGIASLRYYTVLSNILCAVICLVYIIKMLGNNNIDNFIVSKWMKTLRLVVVICLLVTFIVVITVLIPTNGIGSLRGYLFERANLFHHLLCPLMMAVTYLVFEKNIKLGRKEELFAVVPTVLYALVTIILNVIRVMEGPYPFLYVYEQSLFASAMWIVVIVGGAYGVAVGFNKINNIGGGK